MCSVDFFLAVLALLFPPVTVWIKRGICSADSLINICLCMLGFVPGLLHAWYIIAKYPDNHGGYAALEVENGGPNGSGSSFPHFYYYAPGQQPQPQMPPHGPQSPAPQAPGYATFQTPYQSHPGTPYVLPHQQFVYQQQHGVVGPQGQQGPVAGPSSGEGSNGSQQQGQLPSYAEVVKGDFKVQTHD